MINVLALALTLAAARAEPNAAYVKTWATASAVERCRGRPSDCSWMSGFGAIDVGCSLKIDRVGLRNHSAGPKLTFQFAGGETLSVTAATAKRVDRFALRPALCEYKPARRPTATTDVGLLVVANSPAYLMRLWPLVLNKLLYAVDAGLRPFVWVGELPVALEKPTSAACLASAQVKALRSHAGKRRLGFYDGAGKSQRDPVKASNHYVKMPATLAALDAPGISGLYYVDLDAVARWPWTVDESLFRVHRSDASDVSFLWEYPTTARGGAPASDDPLRWLVHGSRFYVRDSPGGRAFFARWFQSRCTFKDQYSLWHTILEFAAEAGCIDYKGEDYRLPYGRAKHLRPATVAERHPALLLTCEQVDKRCPAFRYATTGGRCDPRPPPVVEQLYHHTIPDGGSGTWDLALAGGASAVVENACFKTPTRDCETAGGLAEYAQRLGLEDRDNSVHPWGD